MKWEGGEEADDEEEVDNEAEAGEFIMCEAKEGE